MKLTLTEERWHIGGRHRFWRGEGGGGKPLCQHSKSTLDYPKNMCVPKRVTNYLKIRVKGVRSVDLLSKPCCKRISFPCGRTTSRESVYDVHTAVMCVRAYCSRLVQYSFARLGQTNVPSVSQTVYVRRLDHSTRLLGKGIPNYRHLFLRNIPRNVLQVNILLTYCSTK